MYSSIWENLKRDGTVSLTANKLFHSRIIKATKKRKWIDMGYRMELLEKNQIAVLSHSIEGSVITIKLELRPATDFRSRNPITVKDI